ncbi:MAG: prepilin-type N-terminal cleavage/methylation domain-containing protein [Patescibacteria group bacterium]
MKIINSQKGFTPPLKNCIVNMLNRFGFFRKHSSSTAGFTIVEVLVTTFVFSVIATVTAGLFIQVLAVERRAFAAQKIQENGLFINELMSREIRVSQIQDQESPSCSLTSLTIIHPVNGAVTYSLANGVLQRTADGVTTDLSSSSVAFSRLNFCVIGSGPADLQQSRVTIVASIQNKTGREILTTNLETTVSSRDVDTEI